MCHLNIQRYKMKSTTQDLHITVMLYVVRKKHVKMYHQNLQIQ